MSLRLSFPHSFAGFNKGRGVELASGELGKPRVPGYMFLA